MPGQRPHQPPGRPHQLPAGGRGGGPAGGGPPPLQQVLRRPGRLLIRALAGAPRYGLHLYHFAAFNV